MKIQPVILCGKDGMWTLPRKLQAGQAQAPDGAHTLLQSTALRIYSSAAMPNGLRVEQPLLVVHEAFRFTAAKQLRAVNVEASTIILEPVGRSSAPALTSAALAAARDGEDPVLLVMPVHHVVTKAEAFCKTVAQAAELATTGRLVVLGIAAAMPQAGYRYIQYGDRIPGYHAHNILRSMEKPDFATAPDHSAAGDFLRNSGIYVMRASVWLKQLELFRPDILGACKIAMADCDHDRDFLHLDEIAFTSCPAASIDHAVVDKLQLADNGALGAILPLIAGWSDVGAWRSVWEGSGDDDLDSVAEGEGLVFSEQGPHGDGKSPAARIDLRAS